jgi:hypothetical protein
VASGCGSGVSVPVGGVLNVSPGAVDFGTVPVGTKVDSSISVTNSGSAPIDISQVSVSGETFSVLSTNSAPVLSLRAAPIV